VSLLPTPILSLASQQLTGRGRGTNIWLSPSGCLQFSLLLRTSLAILPPSRLVFVQYLFSLAVVEACREETILGKLGEKVRLKWPNDLYAIVGSGDADRQKIGGILVNTSLNGNKVEIVIGGFLLWGHLSY
jgi:biotin---protein ligase